MKTKTARDNKILKESILQVLEEARRKLSKEFRPGGHCIFKGRKVLLVHVGQQKTMTSLIQFVDGNDGHEAGSATQKHVESIERLGIHRDNLWWVDLDELTLL